MNITCIVNIRVTVATQIISRWKTLSDYV